MTRKIKFKTLICLLICTFSLSLLLSLGFNSIEASAISDEKSIVADWINPVLNITINNGQGMFDSDESAKRREELNDSIYNGTSTGKSSLYDRFGGQISFIPYFGETKIQIGLLDKFYTLLLDNMEEFELSVDDILELFEGNTAISNNCIYEGRPNILSSEAITSGKKDPRVSAYSGISFVGGDAALGNFMLSVANGLTQFISWLSGSGIFKMMNEVVVKASNSDLGVLLLDIIGYFLPFVIGITLIMTVSKSIKYAKGNLPDGRKFFQTIITYLISLGLIFSLAHNPTVFSNLFEKAVTLIDDEFDKALMMDSNEVVQSDNLENVRTALLWNKSIFEPWCYGTFGANYSNLYTQFDIDHSGKMSQSNDDVKTPWTDGSTRYNSVDLTGDIVVPLSGGEEIRNWAALAWSCQSLYHIEAVEGSVNSGVRNPLDGWPKATLTPNNTNIYVDNFRWLDAKMNISPEYVSPTKVYMDYSNSNKYTENFVSAGSDSIFLSLMLIPIAILAIRKIKQAVLIIFAGFRLCYYSIMNFVLQEDYDLILNIKKVLKPIYDYFWWSVIVFVAISLYIKLVGDNFIVNVVYVALVIYLNVMKPIRTPAQLSNALSKVGNGISSFVGSVKEGVSNRRRNKR